MNTFSITCIISILVLSLIACNEKIKPKTSEHDVEIQQIEEYAKEKFGSDYIIDFNETKEFALVTKLFKIKPSDPLPTVRFEILQVKPFEALFMDAVPGGKVSWVEDYIVEAISERVIPGPNEDFKGPRKYRYHAKSRKKYSGGFMNKN